MEHTKSVGIWIRVSTEDQAKGDSPEHHEKRARLYAEAKGWHIEAVYHLEAVSGKSVMEHPEAKKMLKDIRNGAISGLIFSKLARLARNTKELLEFADIFRAHDADLISIHESIDTSTPAGRLFYTMIAAMAQWEREEIASRISASVPIRAKLGKQIGGLAPYGYKWENKYLVINEEEAPVRKLIYELFLKHKRKRTTATELNSMGYRTRTGKLWSDTTVEMLLRNPTAKGVHRANYTTMKGGGSSWELKPESEWVFTKCPAIITEELWNECNRILDVQDENKKAKPGRKAVHLLSGFIYCAACGKKMYVYHKDLKYACRPCKNRIAVSDIDEIFHEQLKNLLYTEVDLDLYLKKSEQEISTKDELLKTATEEAGKLKTKMNDLVSMRLNNELSRETFTEHHKPMEDRYAQLQEQITTLEAQAAFLRVQYESSDTVLQEAKGLYNRWFSMPEEEKRTIVEVITKSITVGKEDIHIKLAYLPTTSQNAGKEQTKY
ncbi:MAG: recombinase family protein [Bacteroidetes bacterium]|nr:recombinase family protein [Bacteroidota bacterium]